MKVTVQNGSQHPVSRNEMEAIVQEIPTDLLKGIASVCMYKSDSGEPYVEFYEKEQILGFFGHASTSTVACKLEALEMLAFALIFLRDTNSIPSRISKAKRSSVQGEVSALVDKWRGSFGG